MIRIGISGWRYEPWRGIFYPPGLAQKKELAFASRQLRSIEINGSFYSLQRPSSYRSWYDETPDDFVFAVKGGRFISHNKKLKDCAGALSNFFAQGVLSLQEKLGPILWQLPPQLSFSLDRIDGFLSQLPKTTFEAAAIGMGHDHRLKHGSMLDPVVDRPLRYAMEVRHPSFADRGFVRVLEKHGVSLCIADTAGKWPYLEEVTADFVYVRLHGDKELYVSGYSPAALDRWAEKIERWHRSGDVYAYFDNDVKVRAPYDAMNLAARLGHGQRVRLPMKTLRGVTEEDRWRSA